jgi:hypothetical protein
MWYSSYFGKAAIFPFLNNAMKAGLDWIMKIVIDPIE